MEKERSAKITSLPPPPPTLFENIEVKRISNVKTSSSTYHHLYTFVSREIDTKQPDPHLAAEEEAKRLEEVQKQAVKERMEQNEKAHVRGFQAMKKIQLAQNQEKLMKELKQLQQEDLARRRQTVAQMPSQLLELPYKRSEMKEDWQRELEFAFEDMYNADRKVKGNLILHLEPEPLPTVTDQIEDELDLSMEQENLDATENLPVTEAERTCFSEADVSLAMKTHQPPSKILFKKLLNKIRSQKSLWTIKSMSEDESEATTTVSEAESKAPTVKSGTTAVDERTLSSAQEEIARLKAQLEKKGMLGKRLRRKSSRRKKAVSAPAGYPEGPVIEAWVAEEEDDNNNNHRPPQPILESALDKNMENYLQEQKERLEEEKAAIQDDRSLVSEEKQKLLEEKQKLLEEKEKMLEDLRREQQATELLAAKYKVRALEGAGASRGPQRDLGWKAFLCMSVTWPEASYTALLPNAPLEQPGESQAESPRNT